MKKINFLIVSLFLSFWGIAQEKGISTVVNARMPDGAKSITKQQVLSSVSHFKTSQIIPDEPNVYQIDNVFIQLWDRTVDPAFKKSLEASQLEAQGYLKENDANVINYTKIITVNNIRFLTYEYQQRDEVYLVFWAEVNKEYKTFGGIIQFKKPDEDKAHKILQDLLSSVHFKN